MNWRKLFGRSDTIWFPVLLMILLADCRRPVRLPAGGQEPDRKERMEKVNEFLVTKDQEVISNFIGRMGWKMERTETGLWYMIMEKGDGPAVAPEKTVVYDYRISLLDGTLCYSSEEDGTKTIRTGYSGEGAGLEEGILMLREGSHARFIMPPHLAFGMVGDGNRIPARATLVYEVWVLDVQ
ncbi:MAG: FKBP-type peptidyl-prolyl cis-trans isomerase [Bacteroidales bacterium]